VKVCERSDLRSLVGVSCVVVAPRPTAQSRMAIPTVSGLPALRWLNDLAGDASYSDGALTMSAKEKTDWYASSELCSIMEHT
jgi:hypothetical protein